MLTLPLTQPSYTFKGFSSIAYVGCFGSLCFFILDFAMLIIFAKTGLSLSVTSLRRFSILSK
ncbi:hypothetical protein MCHI_000064 [Candidatus Magnetoovum chiemensis]|nr:hypothetical protein MCHI_000064 [Candidatus Magnetoovum chiemensis]